MVAIANEPWRSQVENDVNLAVPVSYLNGIIPLEKACVRIFHLQFLGVCECALHMVFHELFLNSRDVIW